MGRRKVEIDAQELRELSDIGMTTYELAEHFGCSCRVIARRKHEYGIIYGRGHAPSNIKANHDSLRRNMGKQNVHYLKNDPLEKREADFIKRLAADPRTQMYEYVGGYKTWHDKVTIRCRKCGAVKEKTPHDLFSSQYDHHICFNCMRIEKEKAKAEKAEERRRKAKEDRICPTCGSVFRSPYEDQVYCSSTCKNTAKKRRRNYDSTHRRRARKYGVEYDPSITWKSLSKKLGHCNCEICGEPCDPNDKRWGYIGPLHPTVDCIVAMANGGGYVHGNVQLAHAICNSAKRDLIDEDEIAKAVTAIAHDGGRDAQRHAAGTAEAACA